MAYVPFRTAKYRAKQVNPSGLTPWQSAAFYLAFSGFLGTTQPSAGQEEALERAADGGVSVTWQNQPDRRFAGDWTLPPNRYYTLVNSIYGADGKALAMELAAYNNPILSGPLLILDLADPSDVHLLLGEGARPVPAIAIVFLQLTEIGTLLLAAMKEAGVRVDDALSLAGRPIPGDGEVVVVVPYGLWDLPMEPVIDLRYPDAQEWFVEEFGTTAFERDLMRDPELRRVKAFHEILPALLTPIPGGGMFEGISQSVGHWMRVHGVEGFVYPSARTNAMVQLRDGEVEEHAGWNLVDYRGAPAPFITVVLDFSVGPPPPLPPGVSIVLPPTEEPAMRGSFAVRGLLEWHLERLGRPGASGVLERR